MKVIVQNLAVEYSDEGTGQIVVCLHGWKDTLHSFDLMTKDLVSNHRIIRLDLPGFGATETPVGVWNLDDYVNFVKDFLSKINVSPDILLGHSFGGRILIKGVANKTFTARKLILIGAAGISHRRTWRNRVLQMVAKIGRAVTSIPPFSFFQQALRWRLYQSIGSDYFMAGRLKETLVKVVTEDLTSVVSSITMPTLLIWGADDNATPLADGEKLHDLISGSRLEVLTDAGHFVHREKSTEVATLIKDFIH